MQHLVDGVLSALQEAWQIPVRVHRASPIVSLADNYDRLHYPPDGAARDARYTRYVCDTAVLRTQMSAMIPGLLRALAAEPVDDILLACPGLVYRRDCIDRMHTGEPHQLDLWRIRRGPPLVEADLREMIDRVVQGALAEGPQSARRTYRALATSHPYTEGGLQIDVSAHGPEEGRQGKAPSRGSSRGSSDDAPEAWVEIGECGLALPALLAESGLDPAAWSGLAMGLGLDRLVMLRKGLDDIRTLRATDPRIAAQMLDLSPYHAVSAMPPVHRDLSLVVEGDDTLEELGDRVRGALGTRAEVVEAVSLLSETPCHALPEAARARLGIRQGQRNVLLRVTLRALDRTLTHPECNALRDTIYAALHRGTVWHWASHAAPGAAAPAG
ncbi:Phenylalanyl-tRNA synthetase alpha chain [Chondromyces apiculatus DSM 436]|uniref:Phenylalanyl-tRNA synthetase n=2 Tax=Chondromyces apiculatus TaxID=51 RepID=A0A017SXL2_9BACT|nr:Phenylalanyl-tRNA synthetase alpha chain [Chondromyces apiculatus DSM 436]